MFFDKHSKQIFFSKKRQHCHFFFLYNKHTNFISTSFLSGERDGFYLLGYCFHTGNGCNKDVEMAKENYLIAAELGNLDAMINLSAFLDKTDSHRFFWLFKAAISGESSSFLCEMDNQMRNFNSGTGHANVVFAIGRTLKGQINNATREIFGGAWNFDSFIGPANQAFQFYIFQLHSYRTAVNTWALVGIRYQVVKDIRNMIAKLIWDSREEAKYIKKNNDWFRLIRLALLLLFQTTSLW